MSREIVKKRVSSYSEQIFLCKTRVRTTSDDNMVVYRDAHDFPSLDNLLRQCDIFTARSSVPTWMIMHENNTRSEFIDCPLEDFTGMNDTRVKASSGNLHFFEDPVCTVEEKNKEDFILQIAQLWDVPGCDVLR
jgi:hypothetical protein